MKVKLPACVCGAATGKLINAAAPTVAHAADIFCTDCGKHRAAVSELTLKTLNRISQMFGAPAEIVFRCPSSVLDKIQQQDLWLKTHYGPDGRSQYDIITDTFDGAGGEPPNDSDGLEVVED